MTRSTTRNALIALAALVVLLALPHLGGGEKLADYIIFAAAWGLLATGLNLLIGYTGLISFGHAMFFASGAYSFGAIMQAQIMPVPLAIVAALIITGAIAALIGAICVRLSEIYFAFLTLAFQMFFHSILLSWVDVTGGDNGLLGGIPTPVFFGVDLNQPEHLYAFCVTVTVLAMYLMHRIVSSPFGFTLRMIRDNERRAIFLGVNVFAVKLTCFVLSAVFSSVGGIILALFISGAYPDFAFWTTSGEAIFMVMLGGLTNFFGPILGALILTGLNDIVVTYTDHYGLFLGGIILLFSLGLRKGVLDFVKPGGRKSTPAQPTADAKEATHADA
ncbi:ABC transporter permease [Actibacterium mucosum KCTC 23349]|uniref:ABC transporter permease n=1 Tax=Actibacterium mucosum KCTC 23349 TaxID=1454373 RepID=A0A037ZD27_9RHOB|nr:branched-chain amino acid ABC transporter permease [Actibacterium mucosum]KAJ54384.1 ABC transporter permease [Actibacterium mucosum KCTC 23349]